MFPQTHFQTVQAETRVVFNASLCRLGSLRNRSLYRAANTRQKGTSASGPAAWDFPTSLRKVLRSYLSDGCPNIEFAAGIVGCSVRTLQRRLKQLQLSYSEIVQQPRYESAVRLLGESGTSVIDAAYAVGYSDPAHFSRAFKRLAGVSPIQFQAAS